MFNEEEERLRRRWPPPRINPKPLTPQEGKEPAKSPKVRAGLKTANAHSGKAVSAAHSAGVKCGNNGSAGGHGGSSGGHGGSSGGHGGSSGGHGGSSGGHGGSSGGHGGSSGGH